MLTRFDKEVLGMPSGQSKRIAVYVHPAMFETIDNAIEASGKSKQEWLRGALASALEPDTSDSAYESTLELQLQAALKDNTRLEDALADTRQSKDRLETLLAQSQATVSRMALALPAPADSSDERPWWYFWSRA